MSTMHVVRDGAAVVISPVSDDRQRLTKLETYCNDFSSGPAYLLPHELRELGAELMALANRLEGR